MEYWFFLCGHCEIEWAWRSFAGQRGKVMRLIARQSLLHQVHIDTVQLLRFGPSSPSSSSLSWCVDNLICVSDWCVLIVYLQGTFLLSKAVSQHMVENKTQSGSIINISSIVGKVSTSNEIITVFGYTCMWQIYWLSTYFQRCINSHYPRPRGVRV